jgi:ParB family chromosome partitioning protein
MNKRALGRGLHTLLPNRSQEAQQPMVQTPSAPVVPTELPIESIIPNPFQPRKHFETQALQELAQSIRQDGVIQPLVVRKAGDGYQLIAGERRWRASKLAGLTLVPVHIQQMPDDRMLEVALVENIQREDLNSIEEAEAFHRLSEDLGLSHEEIGQRTGKDRATVSNSIRLLQLPGEVQAMVAAHKLSSGHGRALLRLPDAEAICDLARKAIQNNWSVRHLEVLTTMKPTQAPAPGAERALDPNVKAAIDELERVLGTRVRIIEKGKGRGKLEIEFYSGEDLDRIYSAIVAAA